MLREARTRSRRLGIATVCVVVLLAASAEAQFLGHNFPGDYGLMSGSQPPPGRYAGVLAPFYRSDTVAGEELERDRGNTLSVWGVAPLVWVVTDTKILGGNYAFTSVATFSNTSLELPRLDVEQSQFGFADLYVVPFQLGWHGDRYDAIASYGFFAPTGGSFPLALPVYQAYSPRSLTSSPKE